MSSDIEEGPLTSHNGLIVLQLCCRNLYANYRNDDYFLQKMLQSELIFNLPEELAERLRKAF